MSALAFLDLAVATVLIATASHVLRCNRMGLAGLLLAALALLLLGAQFFGLAAVACVMRVALVAIAIGLAAAFRHELRHAFERFAAWFMRRRRPRGWGDQPVRVLSKAILEMANGHVGALLVFPGREAYEHHLSGGTELHATISVPLLHSIFDSNSPGHDGAVVVTRRLERFGVHLPLSENVAALGQGGTRHAAALGLAERCDAACLAISEERGTISLARDGEMQCLGPEQLVDFLENRLGGGTRRRLAADDHGAWGGVGVDAAIGATLATLLWVFVAPGVSKEERTIEAPVEVVNLPESVQLAETHPERVEVALGGPRADLFRLRPDEVRVVVDGGSAVHGDRRFEVSREDVVRPPSVEVIRVRQPQVEVELQPSTEASGHPAT